MKQLILEPDDKINSIFDYDNLIKGDTIYIIEIVGFVKEPSDEEYNKYPRKAEYYNDETQESYYDQRTFVGKTGFYNFKIPTSLIEDSENICLNNCTACYNDFCFKCKDNYYLNEEIHTCSAIVAMDTTKTIYSIYIEKTNSINKCLNSCQIVIVGLY